MVAFVGSRGLPGHPPGEDNGEQPLVLIGSTPDGFVYSDPSFSSSLGYGLQMSDTDLLSAWDAATRPRQGLAFVPRPKLPGRQAHIAEAHAPEVLARVLATSTPAPVVVLPTSVPTAEPAAPTAVVIATALPAAAKPTTDAGVAQPAPPADWSWTVLVGVGAVGLGTLLVRLLRARRSS